MWGSSPRECRLARDARSSPRAPALSRRRSTMATVNADATTVLPGIEVHPHARAVLSPALSPQRPSHAYLFHGPSGTGKRAIAREFAAALLMDGARDPGGVAERVARGSHPDLSWVTPSGAAEMLVGDIEEPVVAAAARPPVGTFRRGGGGSSGGGEEQANRPPTADKLPRP